MPRTGIDLIAPPEIQTQGIGFIASDLYSICERVQEIDPAMYVALIYPRGSSNPREDQRFALMRNTEYGPDLVHIIQNEDGSFRPLDGRVLHWMRECDLHRPENSNAEIAKRRRQAKEAEEKERRDLIENIARDGADALRHDGVILAPRVSMHISDRERRRSGKKV